MSKPWLSVIVPTYNGAAYLAQTLASIECQVDGNIEVIAVDDGSSDATLAILNAYSSRLPIRTIRRGRIGNWVANTNFGLAEARGEYVSFLHQDDLWLPGRSSCCGNYYAASRKPPCSFTPRDISTCEGVAWAFGAARLPQGAGSPSR